MELAAITPAAQAELRRMGVRLCVVNSSTGRQVRESVADSPDNTVPAACFFGDPTRASFRFVDCEYGIGATLVRGLAQVPRYLPQLVALVALGGVLGSRKQQLTNPDAAWQQGANALFQKQTGKVLYRHRHRHPMDLGQPIEETARALGYAVTPAMHLDFAGALDRVTSRHPLVHAANRLFPWLLALAVLWLLWRFRA